MVKRNKVIKGSKGELIMEIGDNHEGIRPKVRWDMYLN